MKSPAQRLLLFFAIVAVPALFPSAPPALAQTAQGPGEFTIGGAGTTPVVVSATALKTMPRTTLRVMNPHDQKTEVYEGVALGDLLGKAGVPQGEQLKGPWLADYVVVEAADGYRVVFSLAELDAGYLDSAVLVADTLDGAPLGANEGPFKLIAPREKQAARWVRMLKSITIVRAPNP